ncbi:hypothetical protein [Dyella mobilis]|uniref:PH domain-containing protein n=1 Tax=Dyella mobilis TaxID=1849582 RepID=A0ABS2KDJ4_9GAMM|nr:hypothetical protein [Dyella mobilis]MBM7129241.1 hypothetical protein [Dyella mobilis]
MSVPGRSKQSFGYSRTVAVLFFAVAAFVALVVLRAVHEDGGVNRWSMLGMGMLLFFVVVGWYAASFSVMVSADSLVVSSLFSSKTIALSSIDEAIVYKGLKANWLELRRRGDLIYRVRDSIDGYPRLADDILSALGGCARTMLKDKFGNEREFRPGDGFL